jgi:hypothetical protein
MDAVTHPGRRRWLLIAAVLLATAFGCSPGLVPPGTLDSGGTVPGQAPARAVADIVAVWRDGDLWLESVRVNEDTRTVEYLSPGTADAWADVTVCVTSRTILFGTDGAPVDVGRLRASGAIPPGLHYLTSGEPTSVVITLTDVAGGPMVAGEISPFTRTGARAPVRFAPRLRFAEALAAGSGTVTGTIASAIVEGTAVEYVVQSPALTDAHGVEYHEAVRLLADSSSGSLDGVRLTDYSYVARHELLGKWGTVEATFDLGPGGVPHIVRLRRVGPSG